MPNLPVFASSDEYLGSSYYLSPALARTMVELRGMASTTGGMLGDTVAEEATGDGDKSDESSVISTTSS